MELTTVTGMVLSSTPMGDYDKRVVLLTKEKGKLSAFAKGARRPSSPLMGVVTPFSFGEFMLYEGKNSNTLSQGVIHNYFPGLRTDLEAAYYGFYFMEMADYYAREYNDEKDLLLLLYQTLRALEKKKVPFSLIRSIYELKFLYVNGEGPEVFQCMKTGRRDVKPDREQVVFSPSMGGICVGKRKGDITDGILLSQSLLYTLQYIASSDMKGLYTFLVSDEVARGLQRILKEYMHIRIGHHFRSEEMIEAFSTLS